MFKIKQNITKNRPTKCNTEWRIWINMNLIWRFLDHVCTVKKSFISLKKRPENLIKNNKINNKNQTICTECQKAALLINYKKSQQTKSVAAPGFSHNSSYKYKKSKFLDHVCTCYKNTNFFLFNLKKKKSRPGVWWWRNKTINKNLSFWDSLVTAPELKVAVMSLAPSR